MATLFWVLIIILIILVLYIIISYNRLITLRNRIENAWSQINVQLKRRYDLIPNLVEIVKGYAKHEKETFKMVTEARSKLITGSLSDRAKASDMITNALKSIFAVAEAYPKLMANENFKMLQEELSGTESKIAYSRQFYNDSVMEFNILIQKFPTNIISNMFNFKEREFFKTEGKEKEPIKVKF